MGLDAFMARFDVSMRHETLVHATPAQAYQALRAVDLTESWLAAALFWLRGLGRTRRAAPVDFLESVQRNGFVLLADRPDQEIIFGVAGKFWLPSGGRVCDLTRADFLAFAEEGFAKATWAITFATEGGSTVVATETRVACLGSRARRRFRFYWTFVRPFSGLIRRELLRQVKQRAERTAA